ncbi:HEAT repeat domain-containing protein [Cumulibacter soli]|uniref:HEAT repeat domain-containing protein n=1 Tax=Cumulibacter soli TaxID=2546344 RepID=UPI00106739FD|nr:HEAT repeat domain-containing protein [Cumulibacter soli]
MTQLHSAQRLARALTARDSSARLRAALAAGTQPEETYIPVLVDRCAVEPDFFVRDMLTWALIRHDKAAVLERVLPQLRSNTPQARSQAIHTISKIGDPATAAAITTELLTDVDDETARAAWRTAVALVRADQHARLADTLATQFGRGSRDVQLSLSRAFVELGEVAAPVIERAKASRDDAVRLHALATERIVANPDEGFDAAIAEAQRTVSLLDAPGI